jgi:hypothetical protein
MLKKANIAKILQLNEVLMNTPKCMVHPFSGTLSRRKERNEPSSPRKT